jgi:ComF family protein
MECREKPKPSYDAALALYPYAGRYQNLLSSYKFGTHRNVAVFLAERLAQVRQRHGQLYRNADAWVPVPPKQGKIKHKGWDQVDLIAHRLYRIERSGMLSRGTALPSIPIVRCLERSASRSQKELDRSQRAINLKGKIRCVRNPPVRILLFDDVITTGATLEACTRELKEKGAETVYALALFYD